MQHAASPPSTLPLLILPAQARGKELHGYETANCATAQIAFDIADDAKGTQPVISAGKQDGLVTSPEGLYMMRPSIRTCLVVILLILAAQRSFAARTETWTEVRSPNFLVLTDADEKQARRVALQFELIRSIFFELFNIPGMPKDPVITIIAVKDEDGLKRLLPEFWASKGLLLSETRLPAGVYVAGPDKDHIALQLDRISAHEAQEALGRHAGDPFENLHYGYVHSLVGRLPSQLPLWMVEGLAEFFGSTEMKGHQIVVGAPSSTNLDVLNGTKLLPLGTLFAVDASSPYYHEQNRASIVYAQSWLLTKYLVTRDWREGTHRVTDFVRLIGQSVKPEEAARRTIGDPGNLQKELERYLNRDLYSAPGPPKPSSLDANDFTAEPASPADSLAVRAEFMSAAKYAAEMAKARGAKGGEVAALSRTRGVPSRNAPPPATNVAPADEPYFEAYRLADPITKWPLKEIKNRILELNGLKPATDQSQLPGILRGVSENLGKFVTNFVNIAATESVDEAVGRRRPQDESDEWKDDAYGFWEMVPQVVQKYRYLVMGRKEGGALTLIEYRTDLLGQEAPTQKLAKQYIETTGFAAMPLFFGTFEQPLSDFRLLGQQKIGSDRTEVVAFAEHIEPRAVMGRFNLGEASIPILLQGVAWIRTSDYQILKMRTDLLGSLPSEGFQQVTTVVLFARNQLQDSPAALWLPKEVGVKLRLGNYVFSNRHKYSDYQMFRVKAVIRTDTGMTQQR